MKGKQVGKGEMVKVGDQVRIGCMPFYAPFACRLAAPRRALAGMASTVAARRLLACLLAARARHLGEHTTVFCEAMTQTCADPASAAFT